MMQARKEGSRTPGLGSMVMMLANAMLGILVMSSGVVGQQAAVGPINAITGGYPVWFRDNAGVELELCTDWLDTAARDMCNFVGNEADPTRALSFPDNWPGETFWFMGEAAMLHPNGVGTMLLVLAVEAAFSSGEVAIAGDQVAFGRLRIRFRDMPPGQKYTVKHPYGVNTVTTGVDGSVFVTEDVGALTTPADYSLTLRSPVTNNFLRWGSVDEPEFHIGDPAIPHTVIGSPENFNAFSVCPFDGIGPCFETNLFSIMGKKQVTSGVEVMRANFFTSAMTGRRSLQTTTSNYIEVFAKSAPLQTLYVSGAAPFSTIMKGDMYSDIYYAKVAVADNLPPTMITVTNMKDGTASGLAVTDAVEITSVEYDGTGLVVKASSSHSTATLTSNYGGPLTADAAGVLQCTLVAPTPPKNVVVSSSSGGSATAPVELVGANFPRILVEAVAKASRESALPGEWIILDGTTSTGDIATYTWTSPSGGLTDMQQGVEVPGVKLYQVPSNAAETQTFTLTVTDAFAQSAQSVDTVAIGVDTLEQPVASVAASALTGIVAENVELDGRSSMAASSYQWTQTSGIPVVIMNADQALASFAMPITSETLTFELKVRNIGSFSDSIATVTVTQIPDSITVVEAQFRTDKDEIRVRGSVGITSVANEVSIYRGDNPTELIGTATADPLAVPMWNFRLESAALGNDLPSTIIVVSKRGATIQVELSLRN